MVLYRGRSRRRRLAKGRTMVSEAGIYRSAQVMVRQHGDNALEIAWARANTLRNSDDDEGVAVWMRIARAIENLQ